MQRHGAPVIVPVCQARSSSPFVSRPVKLTAMLEAAPGMSREQLAR
jgi:hypothetical protein